MIDLASLCTFLTEVVAVETLGLIIHEIHENL